MPQPTAQPSIPASYVATLLALCEEWGVSAMEILEGSRLDEAMLHEADARLPFREVNRLLTRAMQLTGEPALAYHLAPLLTLSAHGLLGFGAMASATLQDAIRLVEAFGALRIAPFSFHLDTEDDTASLCLGSAMKVPVFYAETVLLILYHAATTLLGKLPDTLEIRLEGREPDYYRRYSESLPLPLHYGATHNCIRFPATLLDQPLPMAALPLEQIARTQCERELEELQQASPLAIRVKRLMRRDLANPPDLPSVAAMCRISTRTLKRQLADSGSSYGELLDELRHAEACRLMLKPRCSLKVVAQQLGFSTQANFSRAFRRWSGVSPRDHIKKMKAANTLSADTADKVYGMP